GPGIGMLADPFTGVEIIQTDVASGDAFVEVIGGTSLACPLFSGVMAIAAQKAGHGLGQAAPLLYGLSSGIRDIQAPSLPNVAGDITTSAGTTHYSPDQLAHPATGMPFLDAFYNSPSTGR